MSICEICKKPLKANTYVRLDDNFESGKRAHVKCFAKTLFSGASDKEIKVKRLPGCRERKELVGKTV